VGDMVFVGGLAERRVPGVQTSAGCRQRTWVPGSRTPDPTTPVSQLRPRPPAPLNPHTCLLVVSPSCLRRLMGPSAVCLPPNQHSWSPTSKAQQLRVVLLLAACLAANVYFGTFWVHVLGGEGLSLTLLLVADVGFVAASPRPVAHACTCCHRGASQVCPAPTPRLVCQLVIISIGAAHTLARYGIQLYDYRHGDAWESRTTVAFSVEFLFDMVQLVVTLAHYLHIWIIVGYVGSRPRLLCHPVLPAPPANFAFSR
jgi:hypothetical protein